MPLFFVATTLLHFSLSNTFFSDFVAAESHSHRVPRSFLTYDSDHENENE
jgi:hypothetical protein